jgi:hypothetical protein
MPQEKNSQAACLANFSMILFSLRFWIFHIHQIFVTRVEGVGQISSKHNPILSHISVRVWKVWKTVNEW